MENLYSPYSHGKETISFYNSETKDEVKNPKIFYNESKVISSSNKIAHTDCDKLSKKSRRNYSKAEAKCYSHKEKEEVANEKLKLFSAGSLHDKLEIISNPEDELCNMNTNLLFDLDRRSSFRQIMQYKSDSISSQNCFMASMRRDFDPWTTPYTQERGKLKFLKSSPSLFQLRSYYKLTKPTEPVFDKLGAVLNSSYSQDDENYQNLENLKNEINHFKLKAQNYFLLYKNQEKEINTLRSEYERSLKDVKDINLNKDNSNKGHFTSAKDQDEEDSDLKSAPTPANKKSFIVQKNKHDLCCTKTVHRIKSPEVIKSLSDDLQEKILGVISRNKGCITERINLTHINTNASDKRKDDKSVEIHEILIEDFN